VYDNIDIYRTANELQQHGDDAPIHKSLPTKWPCACDGDGVIIGWNIVISWGR